MTEIDAHLRRIWRATLTPTALLTRDEVIAALPGDPDDVGAWLDAHVAASGQVAGTAVFRWGDVLDVVRGEPADAVQPITSWRAAAVLLGVSEDTVSRRRRERDPTAKPYFDSAEALRGWWRGLLSASAVAASRGKRKGAPPRVKGDGAEPSSWHAFAHEVIAARRGDDP